MKFDEQILAASAKHPQPGRTFQYGTAGVRPATVPETLFLKANALGVYTVSSQGVRDNYPCRRPYCMLILPSQKPP